MNEYESGYEDYEISVMREEALQLAEAEWKIAIYEYEEARSNQQGDAK